jgi:hypothetical protein
MLCTDNTKKDIDDMKKYVFNNIIKYKINATLFQQGKAKLFSHNIYLHLSLIKQKPTTLW